ncbi:T9SS type A sorting domain-containing protein [Seonamhaeicola sediminis]|uniref:T9SS type A sorting domain-containing protein n=1 Tax=Seonamhaeicola sediminis TaxID=2528206 RepID=A0A562YGP7_9FLAO|nr:T9SS type A sorting domain-containing protein [Seonamhaeicola sediminis]TWO34000.1 T9SS type A sorting domain-containing protein [Seonamhaeicola sediminis]
MKRTTISFVFFLVSVFHLNAQSAKQGFDNKEEDNWNYSSNIPFYFNNGGTDVWRNQSSANGRIAGPHSGSSYLAGRDLDNEYSEQQTGQSSPEHILVFDSVYIGGLEAELSFQVQYIGLDKGDYIYYELRYDNATDWNSADFKEDVFKTTSNRNFNSVGWNNIKYIIPSGHDYVRMRLVVYQNGNEYLGFDKFELETATLSNKDGLINGFSFGPNPTRNHVNFKANVVLDEVSIYNILGKQLLRRKLKSKQYSVDLTNYPVGIYIMKVESEGIIQTSKIIKR